MHADYAFINGEVITVGPDDRVFQAAAVGKFADLIVLDESILSASPEGVLSMKPTLTIINGEIVYGGEDEGGLEGRSRLSAATSPAR